MRIEVRFGSGDKESASLMKYAKPCEIDITSIHDIYGARFRDQQIGCLGVVHFAVGNVDEAGNAAAQVQQSIHLHGRFGGSEVRPRRYRQTQVDGRRIQRKRCWLNPVPDRPGSRVAWLG